MENDLLFLDFVRERYRCISIIHYLCHSCVKLINLITMSSKNTNNLIERKQYMQMLRKQK